VDVDEGVDGVEDVDDDSADFFVVDDESLEEEADVVEDSDLAPPDRLSLR